MSNKEKEYKFSGKVVRCTYNTPDFKIFALNVDKNKYPEIKHNKYNNVSILGELSDLAEGIEYEIVAVEQMSKYGASYKVLNIKRDLPTTQEDMYLFLSEILTENQARVLYENYPDIVQRVKENRLDDIDLKKLKGIGEYTFNVIKNKIIENFCLSDLVIEFQGYLTLSIIKKIYNKYSSIDKLKEKLKSDPYKCLCGISGVGFKTADNILLEIEKVSKENIKNGKTPIVEFDSDLKTSPQRCLSCLLYLLQENEKEGHTKMNLADLRKECMKLVPDCVNHFTDVIKNDNIYYDKNTMDVGLKETYKCEKYIADRILSGLNQTCNVWDYDINKYKKIGEFELSDEQTKILELICKNNICILNGFGGSGKTYSTKSIINLLEDNNKTYKLFAPTGRASKVLSENTERPASTLHRGLGYIPPNGWKYDESNPLSSDIIIVDETSMVDIWLFKKLLEAIDFKYTKLLLIGDSAQLPSVSAGNILHDFMSTDIIPTVTLSKIFRYSSGGLAKIATDVRNCIPYLTKDMKNKATTFGNNQDYMFVDLSSELIPKNAVALYKKLLQIGYKTEDIQVLTVKNIGDCGTIALNKMLQKVANPNYGSEVHMKIGDTIYYEGDLLLETVNNYKAELDIKHLDETERQLYEMSDEPPTAFVSNGEIGVLKEIYNTYAIIDFGGTYVKYHKNDMNMVKHGYAINVFKAQGGGFKIVIFCTPQSDVYMLNSNLVYTGLTRMKEKLYHLGTLQTVNMAVKKKANLSRKTFMQNLLLN